MTTPRRGAARVTSGPDRAARAPRRTTAAALALAAVLAASACDGAANGAGAAGATRLTAQTEGGSPTGMTGMPGMTGARGATDSSGAVDGGTDTAAPSLAPYAASGKDQLTGPARIAKQFVYVPNQVGNTLQIIDPRTYRVVARRPMPASPEHVVPSWDFTTLWVNSDRGNALTPINPRTGRVGTPVPVRDPYNLYFTPGGEHALVMASKFRAIDVLDPHTMRLVRSLPVPGCAGVNHADYSADLRYFIASCEFNGRLLVVDRDATKVLKVLDLNAITTPGATPPGHAHLMGGARSGLAAGASAMPQDVRLTPDGRWFVVADMLRNGIWFINAATQRVDHFVPTGMGAHGIYPSRDARRYFVSNRDAGSITVFDATTNRPMTTWQLPGKATPDMGGVTADGSQLWLSGRYRAEVYVIDTTTGRLLHRIPTDAGPHGLLVWPQPGRFSLGHTGNTR